MLLSIERPWFACYDDAGAGAGDAGGDAGAGAGGAGDADPIIKDQAQLNAVLKREKEKFRKDREKLASQLEEHRNTSRLSQEQKDALEAQIEELRTANLTVEERARHQQTKVEKDFTAKLDAATKAAQGWEQRYQNQHIGYNIASAAAAHKVIPGSVVLVESFLRPQTKLVPITGEDGQPTGDFTAKVRFDDVSKDGKPIVLELSIDETIKRMKELPERFGNLFEGGASGGVGGGTGAAGKKPNLKAMDTAAYLEQRKKDPASLGL